MGNEELTAIVSAVEKEFPGKIDANAGKATGFCLCTFLDYLKVIKPKEYRFFELPENYSARNSENVVIVPSQDNFSFLLTPITTINDVQQHYKQLESGIIVTSVMANDLNLESREVLYKGEAVKSLSMDLGFLQRPDALIDRYKHNLRDTVEVK